MQHKRLERLLLFAEVAEHLNFAKAAEKLGISKGHLSEQIKKLEQEYSTPLLVRTTRSVRLTSEGQKALESAREIKYLVNNFERNLQKLDGVIRITAPKLFSEKYLSAIIVAFRQLHPEVKFEINTSYTRFDLNQTQFDMAFRATQQPPPENMVAKKLLSYQHVVAASPAYMANTPLPSSPSDLNKHRCLTAEANSTWSFERTDIHIKSGIACNDNFLLKQLAIAGEGIVKLPDFYLMDEIKQNKLRLLLENEKTTSLDIYLLYPTTTRETARLRRFTSFVTDYFASHK